MRKKKYNEKYRKRYGEAGHCLSAFCFLISAFSFLLSALLHYLVILFGIGTGGEVEMPPFCS